MILHNEVFDQICEIHCHIKSGSLNVSEQIQIFCNSKDSTKYLEAKAAQKIEQENGKIPFLSVTNYSVKKRMPIDEIKIKMFNPPKQEL